MGREDTCTHCDNQYRDSRPNMRTSQGPYSPCEKYLYPAGNYDTEEKGRIGLQYQAKYGAALTQTTHSGSY